MVMYKNGGIKQPTEPENPVPPSERLSKPIQYRCPCIVNLGRSYDPSFVYRIDGKGPEFGFTLKPIPEAQRDWFAGLVMGVIDRAYEHGQQTKVAEIKRGLATTLAAMGLEFTLPKRGG